jgi:hypothetical protein
MSWNDSVRSALSDANGASAQKIARLKAVAEALAEKAEQGDKASLQGLSQILPLAVEVAGENAPVAREFAGVLIKILEPLSNETIMPIGKSIFQFIHVSPAAPTWT